MSANLLWDEGSAWAPCMGQGPASGDRAFLWRDKVRWRALVVDVSGHGQHAQAVAERIAEAELLDGVRALTEVVTSLHRLLQGTVGAAAMAVEIFRIAPAVWRLTAAGVGNVRLWVEADPLWQFDGQPGLLGSHLPPTVRLQQRSLGPHDRVVIVTDGIRSEAREHISGAAPNAHNLAADLLHRYARPHDDATCVAVMLREER